MAKFKVGDRVRIVTETYGEEAPMGSIATVDEVLGHDVTAKIDGGDGFPWFFFFEQVSPALTIREGGYYRTRDGRKVGPILVWEDGEYYHVNGTGDLWREDGTEVMNDADDLIAEWQDEPSPAPAVSDPKFKVGDRVKFVDDYGYGFGGVRATVINVDGCGVQVDTGEKNGISTELASSLCLVAEATSDTTHTIVCRLDNGQPLPARKPYVHASVADASKEATRLAKANPGREFGVYEMVHTVQHEYEHEWQRLAVSGHKIDAIKEVRGITGMTLKGAKDAVEHWLAVNAA